MTATARTTNKCLKISIQNQFDFSMYPAFRQTYRDIDPQTIEQVEVDLSYVTYMDSAALGMLLLLHEHFSTKPIRISNANEHVKQILDIANFSKKFTIG